MDVFDVFFHSRLLIYYRDSMRQLKSSGCWTIPVRYVLGSLLRHSPSAGGRKRYRWINVLMNRKIRDRASPSPIHCLRPMPNARKLENGNKVRWLGVLRDFQRGFRGRVVKAYLKLLDPLRWGSNPMGGSCQLLTEGYWFTPRNYVFLQLWKLTAIYNQTCLKNGVKHQFTSPLCNKSTASNEHMFFSSLIHHEVTYHCTVTPQCIQVDCLMWVSGNTPGNHVALF